MIKLKKILKSNEKVKSNRVVVNKMNYDMLSRITSHVPFSFHELYYVHSNRYHTCLEIFKFPEESTKNFLNKILDDRNIFVTVDCEHLSKSEYYARFNKIVKNNSEESDSTRDSKKSKDKIKEIHEMNTFDNYLSATNEETKTMTIRVYISELSLEKLQSKLDNIITMLIEKKMKGYIQTNDLESEVKSLTNFSNPVGKLVASSTVTDILLKSEISKVDEKGSLLGYTTNGVYCPDFFSFENYSYNYIALGGMGSGKSALIKSLEEGRYILGNHVLHIFDIHGEYYDFGKKLGIPIVEIDDSKSVNACQIFYTFNDNGIIGESDITSKLAVLVELIKSIADETRKDIIDHFELETKQFYNQRVLGKNIHDLKNEDWFTLSGILDVINQKYKDNEYEENGKKDIYKLRISLKNMLSKYGYIYDRVTNMEFDLSKSMIFDISYFERMEDKKVKNAYVSSLMDYVSTGVRINLEKNLKKMKEENIYIYEMKRPFYTYSLVVDETLQFVEDSSFLLKAINLLKYMRKAFAGAGFVIHTYDDTKKVIKSADNKDSYLGELFSLCTNKLVGSTDGASLNELPNIVKSMNEMDVKVVSAFRKGENNERSFLIVDDQKRKFYITSIVNKFQRKYFGGGA